MNTENPKEELKCDVSWLKERLHEVVEIERNLVFEEVEGVVVKHEQD